MKQLVEIYEGYLEKAAQVRAKASPFAGIFGMGDDPRKHPCHENFYETVEQWSQNFDAGDPDETLAAVRYILEAAKEHEKQKDVYWFLYAAHGLTMPLIPALRPADREELAAWYNQTYPKRVRFPVQNQVYRCLQTGKAK